MVFSSPIFLFLFLPVVLAFCALPGLKLRNGLLLLFSVIFYAWGEVGFVFLMLGSTLLNHFLGQWVDRETEPARRKWAVAVAVALNIGTLAFFKYANFVVGNLNVMLGLFHAGPVHLNPVRLPIGISFFTFHALSYVIEHLPAQVGGGEESVRRGAVHLLFPAIDRGADPALERDCAATGAAGGDPGKICRRRPAVL